MQLIDASQSHPIIPPEGGFTAPPSTPVTPPHVVPNTTWANKVPAPPPTPNPVVTAGSDSIGRVVDVRDLKRAWSIELMESPVGAFLRNVLGYAPRVEALSHGTFLHTNSAGIRTNMLLGAADMCFQAHLPLGLRPEVLWYTILSQVATEVKSNPNAYREQFTAKAEGKDTILVRHDGLRLGSAYGWDQAIGMFDAPLRERVPGDLPAVCLPDDLTTCGTSENLACLVAFMDAASPYYAYRVMTMCGIPKVALFGTGEDWSNLVTRLDRLAPRFPALASYFNAIRPLLTRIAEVANGGAASQYFWDSIYKRNSESGGDKLTGWLTHFFAFIRDYDDVIRKRTDYDLDSWGYSPASFPSSVSAVPFVWEDAGSSLPMQLCGGVLTNVEIDGFMTPRLGWAVVHAK